MDPAVQHAETRAVCAALLSDEHVSAATHIAVYVCLGQRQEVDVSEAVHVLLEQGKRLFVPELRSGVMGFVAVRDVEHWLQLKAQPKLTCREVAGSWTDEQRDAVLACLQVAVVPGRAFDTCGGRVGWGRGFYDGALKRMEQLGAKCKHIGLCYSAQLFPEVPMDDHDVRMHRVICQ